MQHLKSIARHWFSFWYPQLLVVDKIMGLYRWHSDKEGACNSGDTGMILGLGRSLEKEITTHSDILAWELPRPEEPWGLQSMGVANKSDMT